MVNGEEQTGLGVSGTGRILKKREFESEATFAKRQTKEFLREKTPSETREAFKAGSKEVRARIGKSVLKQKLSILQNGLRKERDNIIKKKLRLPKFLRDTPSEARAIRTLRNLTRPQKRAPLDVPPQRFRQPPSILKMIPKSFEPERMDFKSNPLSLLFGSRKKEVLPTAQEERESIIKRKDIFFR